MINESRNYFWDFLLYGIICFILWIDSEKSLSILSETSIDIISIYFLLIAVKAAISSGAYFNIILMMQSLFCICDIPGLR